jgi:predicted nuclease of restriction endonuclease-like (RecB) superfamily
MENFFTDVAAIIEQARSYVGRTADMAMCVTYFEIGRIIIEQEQDGKARAEYGRGLMQELSEYLVNRFGRGFSVANLKNARQFYQIYAPLIKHSIPFDPENENRQSSISESYPFKLSWTHYQVLIRIKNEDERRFYEIEATNQQWSVNDLKRQYNSSLYERLALSRNKDDVMRLANEGQTIDKPRDMLKNPLVLEFLGMAEDSSYSETDLESAIISKLQKFLLELGKGFLFEARQKRFSFDEKSFFVDLVFYNRLLKCYVIIDLKTTELSHQDLGQMQMYVHYFDRYVKTGYENPTVGILLCKEKNDSIVELTLPENSNIYASEYNLYLPDKALLKLKLAEWVEEFEKTQGIIEAFSGDDEE